MSFWTRFVEWCRRPDMIKRPGMIKIQRFSPGIGKKYARTNPLQTGISIIMGWTIWIVCASIIQSYQTIIHPGWSRFFGDWGILLLGLSLTSWGIIKKSTRMATILLQAGIVVTTVWSFAAASRYDLGSVLGLPKLHIATGYTRGAPTHVDVFLLVFIGGPPVLGLILVASGIKARFWGDD